VQPLAVPGRRGRRADAGDPSAPEAAFPGTAPPILAHHDRRSIANARRGQQYAPRLTIGMVTGAAPTASSLAFTTAIPSQCPDSPRVRSRAALD